MVQVYFSLSLDLQLCFDPLEVKTSREEKLMMKCLKVGCPFDTDEQILATSSKAVLRMHVDTTHLMGGQEQAGTIASTQVHAERMQKSKLVTSDRMVAEAV